MAKLRTIFLSGKTIHCLFAAVFLLMPAFAAETENLPEPGMEKAQQAVRVRDYVLAAKLFNELAEQGNAAAQYQLGALYETGRGVAKDEAAALRWYTLSAKNGYAKAVERSKEIEQKKTLLRRNTELSKEDLLMAAVTRGNLNEIEQLVRLGADVDRPDAAGRTPLIEAVDQRNAALVGSLLKHGAKTDLRSKDGDDALLAASRKGDKDIAQVLVDAGASVDSVDVHGLTPLMIAVQKSDASFAKFITQHGCDLRKTNQGGRNALDMALSKGDRGMADILTAAGAVATPDKSRSADMFRSRLSGLEKEKAGPDAAGSGSWTPLVYAVWRGETDMVKYLAAKEKDIDATMPDGTTALSCAASRGNPDITEILLKSGAKPWLGRSGATPLELAAENGHEAVVRRLLEEYSGQEPVSSILVRAMSLAVRNGHGPVVKALLDKGVQLSVLKEQARPLFLSAAQKGDTDLLQILMDSGVPVDTQDMRGRSALMVSAEAGQAGVVEYLIRRHADVRRTDVEGHTALALSARAGKKEAVSALIQAKAVLDSESLDGNTPLLLAADGGHREVAEMLMSAGAKTELSNKKGLTPLAVAVRNNDIETTRSLLQRGANPYVSLRIVDNADPAVRELLARYRGPKNLVLKIVESFFDD